MNSVTYVANSAVISTQNIGFVRRYAEMKFPFQYFFIPQAV